MNLKLIFMCCFFVLLVVPAQSRGGGFGRNFKRLSNLRNSFKNVMDDDQSTGDDDFEEYMDRDLDDDQSTGDDAVDEDTDTDGETDDGPDYYDYEEEDRDLAVDDQCNPNPCLNNGVCMEKEGKKKGTRKYKCDCPPPFRGKNCQKGPCGPRTCGKGDCVVASTPSLYECKCREPYQLPNCKQAAEPCQSNPCMNGGSCFPDGKDFTCQCPEGFGGRLCSVGPEDCYQDNGESYRGNVSEAENGRPCLHWNSYFVLREGYNFTAEHDDADGLGPHNFCRNPDGDRKPWCFIRRGRRVTWEYCDVKSCSEVTPSESPSPTGGPVQTTTDNNSSPQFSTCGKPQPKRATNRIYGGLKSTPGALPWQLSLQEKRRNSFGRHFCGAVLIDSCWALTAAHCVDDVRSTGLQVVAGGLTLNSNEPTEQTIMVERIIVHENYEETSRALYNDIALLKLKATNGICARETQFVKAACLPDARLPDGTICTISGWGATKESNSGSDHLLDANVPLIKQETCSRSNVYGRVLDDGMLCAGYLRGGVDSCQGDSGGPLTCEKNGTHVVCGLVSWGDGCARKNKPGVYTRVLHFLDWIKSKMGA